MCELCHLYERPILAASNAVDHYKTQIERHLDREDELDRHLRPDQMGRHDYAATMLAHAHSWELSDPEPERIP